MATRDGVRGTRTALVLALAALGCGGATRAPAERAVDRVEALAEAHASDASLLVRLNPAPCDCPEWEILLDDAWHRVYLEPKDPDGPVEVLRNRLTEAPGFSPPHTARIAGRLSGSTRLSANRVPCLVLKVLQLCGDEGCTPPE
jgi:hypothetical protein